MVDYSKLRFQPEELDRNKLVGVLSEADSNASLRDIYQRVTGLFPAQLIVYSEGDSPVIRAVLEEDVRFNRSSKDFGFYVLKKVGGLPKRRLNDILDLNDVGSVSLVFTSIS